MRIAILSVGLLFSTPLFAQADTSFYSANSAYAGDTMAWSYNPTRIEERRRVLNRVREVCGSRAYADKVRCGNALAIIRAGYAELQARRSAESVITE